ncbi:CDP-6-deoxy-delta-3,4-glucoseen reductase [Cocleimonas flava]|uniref:CDP-4-dehydro-6-deoxyglucose reductase n=1 Tax=Cocleimonas flava TaxID=634765 RepID=A0A4R1EP08_9GAMM|nr:CDP-6-deoxy-delta-3,4-glucoseen reductase [Cocleimonas flava]TCJ83016.1 CDP-4-dehydro-6-deoxyglucose reductase [Cocleimonas flava]
MSYKVTLQPSEHTFEVEENELILDAALRQGVGFPYGCRSGSCGTCLGKVVSGEIEYPQGLPLTVMEHEHEQGKAVFCVSIAKSDLVLEVKEVTSSSDIEIKLLPARVISLRKLADDVMEMQLKLPESERLPFRAGQYIEFIMRDKSRRAFSIANSPSNDEYLELHLRHVPDGKFTDHVFSEMKEKALVRIEGPYGSFHVRENSNRPLILVAGGTGFAPIKAMIEQLIEQADTRPIHLYWGARAKADLYRADLAEKWAFQYPHIEYIPVLSDLEEGSDWEGKTGYVHDTVAEDFADLSGHDVYLAGPPIMIDAAKAAFAKQGLPEDQIFSDAFEYAAEKEA